MFQGTLSVGEQWAGVALSAVAVFILCYHKRTTKFLFQFLNLPAKQIVKENFVVISVFAHKYGSLNLIHIVAGLGKQRIGSCLACVYRVMDARGKFGEHERSVRVARGDRAILAS